MLRSNDVPKMETIYHQLLKRVDLVYDLIVKMKWPQTVRELAMRRAMQKQSKKNKNIQQHKYDRGHLALMVRAWTARRSIQGTQGGYSPT